jgi:beta-phosphoglucomutase
MPDTTRAVIFDMDGVIVDTAAYHFKSWQKIFGKYGVTFTKEQFPHIFGRRDDAIIRIIMGDNVPPDQIQKMSREKEEYFREIVKENIKALPGAVELIKSLKPNNFKVALASSAVPENVNLVLETLKIRPDFDAVTNGLEVTESKPSPQIYLLAASKVGVKPENSIVIEDAVMGVMGAKRGGMKAIAVTTSHNRAEFEEAHPDLVVDTLKEVNIAVVEKLLSK